MTAPEAGSGRDRRFCGGKLRQPSEAHDRGTCTRPAGWGTSHPGWGSCKLHSGSTSAGVAAAEREKTETLLDDARHTFGLPLDVEPADALLALLRTNAGIVAWLGRQVAVIERDKVTTANQKPHPLIAMYADERKQLAAVAKAAIDAGIAERLVRLEEEQGRMVVALIERVLARLDAYVHEQTGRRVLDPLDPSVRAIVASELQVVTAA